MKVFVTGAGGQLGHDLVEELTRRGHAAVGSDLSGAYALDITDAAAVNAMLAQVQPDAVIHCAAWTAVDAAEDAENRAKVQAINGEGTRHIAAACKALGCKMLYISTDYVFDGQGETPWQPDCRAYAPLNVYGQSKLAGEMAVAALLRDFFIVRIAWVFGRNGNNFVKTMLRLGKERDSINVVCDQIGSPTYSYDLARCLVDLIQTTRYGVYHATNEGFCSWAEFAQAIMDKAGLNCKVHPVLTIQYKTAAARPLNSRMSKDSLDRAGIARLPQWEDALERYLMELR